MASDIEGSSAVWFIENVGLIRVDPLKASFTGSNN
jgi:hypothetical protein